MKGLELLSDIFTIFVLIIVFYVLVLGIPLSIKSLTSAYDTEIKYTVDAGRVHLPFKDELVLFSFVESNYEGYPMKKLLLESALQNNTEIYIDGKIIDIKNEEVMKTFYDDYVLFININGLRNEISGDADIFTGGSKYYIKKINYNIPNSYYNTKLELYVYDEE